MALQSYVGARKEIAFTKEATRGTKETHGAGDWQPHLGFDFKPVVEKVKDDRAMGRIEDNINSSIIRTSSEGSVPLQVTKEFAGHILTMLFGQVPVTTGSYIHTYTLANNNVHQSYTISVKDPIKGMLAYPLCVLNELTLEAKPDAVLTATLNMMGSGEDTTTGSPAYSTTDDYFLPKHVTVKFASDVSGLAGASAVDVSSLTMTVSKNAVQEYSLGNQSPVEIENQRFGVGIAFEQTYQETSLRDWAFADVKKAMLITISNGTDSIVLTLPRVAFEDWATTTANNDYLKNTVAIFAERDNTDGMISGVLTNSVASYA